MDDLNQCDDEKIWVFLINQKITSMDPIHGKWINDNEKKFAVNIYKNNKQYLDEHIEHIAHEWIDDMVIIAACYLEIESVFESLINKWRHGDSKKNRAAFFNHDRFLHFACQYNKNLNIIKYLIDVIGMDLYKTDKKGKNCLMVACMHNNLIVIKYLIECKKMDPLINKNCLMLACQSLPEERGADLETIKYLVKIIDPFLVNENDNNCLSYACMHSGNLDVIKYLIEEIGLDPTLENCEGDNCLTIACWKNNSLDVIKYLVENVKMNILQIDFLGYNCFLAACMNKLSDVDIVKFLVNAGADINLMNEMGYSGLDIAKNKKIIDYLVQETDILLKMVPKSTNIEYVIHQLNIKKMNQLIDNSLKSCNKTLALPIINKINPLKLSDKNRKFYNIDPFLNKTYKECVAMIDELSEPVDIPSDKGPCISYVPTPYRGIILNQLQDFSKPSEALFKHGLFSRNPGSLNETFYGHRCIVYEKILLLSGINDIRNIRDQDVPILEGNLPKNAINQYIASCYTGNLSFDGIDPMYFIDFLKFIDQYPTVDVQIDKIQMQIIDYMDRHIIHYDQYLCDLCSKYETKYMYLYMHNKKIKMKMIC